MKMEIEEVISHEALPLLSLNHVSLLGELVRTYKLTDLTFHVRLYNYGIGIHLLENESTDDEDYTMNITRPINPKENHMSFQCTDVELVKKRLEAMGMRYVTAVVEEGGIKVDQVFFHDPDGYMVEICNCDNLPVVPLSSCPFKPKVGNLNSMASYAAKCGLMEIVMMENLSAEMMNFSF
ncbi:hypothetical protein RJ639_011678 [Escallonia herrerae]|uniref:VOC domain-containing protein n=1 Tax=Escallonia herrerae TaxID=1293975 RepID=A0AA89AQS2_9ASTE|nr:hypothetical protein RJ639_011678 [Escallonia herrerae]